MVERSQLSNGIRVVSERLDGAPSVTIGIWVENGSRYERRDQAGISHFLEHLFFKGTKKRSAAEIAECVDSVGGTLNAFTGKECTCYYARVLAEHFGLAADLLSDIFLHSTLQTEEIDRERGVILQEIAQGEDTPDELIHDIFNLSYWRDHPLSYPICGNADTVSGFGRSDFVDFIDARYRPDRIVIACAGNIRHADVQAWVEREFAHLEGSASAVDCAPPVVQPGLSAVDKSLEQVHLCLGGPGVNHGSEQRFAAYVLSTALGGGMSSRLFQEVREKRGRAYSIFSFLSSYRDAGYLGIYAGTTNEWVEEVIDVIRDELRQVVADGLSDRELERSKSQLKGGMLLGLETSDSRMTRLAKSEIYFGKHFTIDEIAASIDAVSNDEVTAFTAGLANADAMGLALLGSLEGRDVGARFWDAA